MAEARFANNVVMITGAAGGFGAAAARRFAAQGATLLLSDLDKPGLDRISSELNDHAKIVSEPIDITSEKEVISHIEHGISNFGKIDVAINNAGIGQALNALTDTSEADFDRIMKVNAKGV
ncbi:MAG: SDR family NAD(P)-dependent oxidoreductase, partial [Rhodobacter sp.]|nr:SDR family NAD(P)-dependent oxidoreductase [Rhodobacter sp.]